MTGGISLSSCSLHFSRKKAPQKLSASASKAAPSSESQAWRTRLGKVVLVDGAHDFVLVDIGTSPAPEPGTKLRSYSDTTISGELNVSAQQRRPYLIADILAGGPKVGDMVVLMPVVLQKPTPSFPPYTSPSQNADGLSSGGEADEAVGKRSGAVGQDFTDVPSMIPRQSTPRPKFPAQSSLQGSEENPSDAIIPGLPVFRKK